MDLPQYLVIYGIGTLVVLLGFLALLAQKIYIAEDGKPTEVELPILGKMRTNYPALIFAFLGVGLLFYGISKCYPPRTIRWEISGQLETWGRKDLDFEKVTIAVFPRNLDLEVKSNGRFVMRLDIPEGETFEGAVQRIDFSHPSASGELVPSGEWNAYEQNPERSKLLGRTVTTRQYKPIPLLVFERGE
jgi:hypothetical protein